MALITSSVEFLERAKSVQGQSLTKLAKEAGVPHFKFMADSAIEPDKVATAISADGIPRVKLIASTTMTDLAADVMTANSQKRMLEAALGTTMFMNHKFNVPMDIFGIVEKAILEERQLVDTFTAKKTKALCLIYTVRVAQSNPLAMQTYATICEGIRLGASVTVLVLDVDQGKDGRQLINDVYYLECSIVGLPMNQYSWVEYAEKALSALGASFDSAMATQALHLQKELKTDMAEEITTIPETPELTPAPAPEPAAIISRSKGIFSDRLTAAMNRVSMWEMNDILCMVLYELQEDCEEGECTDPAEALKEILAEYAQSVTEQLLPGLVALVTAATGGQPQEGVEAAASYSATSSATGEFLSRVPSTQKMLSLLSTITMKSGARHSKADMETLQAIHDHTSNLGAKCMKDMDSEGIESDGTGEDGKQASRALDLSAVLDEMKSKTALFQEDNAKLSKQLEAAQIEKEQWKTNALLMKAKLEQYAREPLPRAGHAS